MWTFVGNRLWNIRIGTSRSDGTERRRGVPGGRDVRRDWWNMPKVTHFSKGGWVVNKFIPLIQIVICYEQTFSLPNLIIYNQGCPLPLLSARRLENECVFGWFPRWQIDEYLTKNVRHHETEMYAILVLPASSQNSVVLWAIMWV